MRRLLRWTFHVLAAASLLLCLATAGLWVRSYWAFDQLVIDERPWPAERESEDLPKYEFMAASRRGRVGGWSYSSAQPKGRTPRWEFQFRHLGEQLASDLTTNQFHVYRATWRKYAEATQFWSL